VSDEFESPVHSESQTTPKRTREREFKAEDKKESLEFKAEDRKESLITMREDFRSIQLGHEEPVSVSRTERCLFDGKWGWEWVECEESVWEREWEIDRWRETLVLLFVK
jgi:hypothetical protein